MNRTYRCEVPVIVRLVDDTQFGARLGYPDDVGNCVVFAMQGVGTLDSSTVIVIPPDGDDGYVDSQGEGNQFENMRTGVLFMGFSVEVAPGVSLT